MLMTSLLIPSCLYFLLFCSRFVRLCQSVAALGRVPSHNLLLYICHVVNTSQPTPMWKNFIMKIIMIMIPHACITGSILWYISFTYSVPWYADPNLTQKFIFRRSRFLWSCCSGCSSSCCCSCCEWCYCTCLFVAIHFITSIFTIIPIVAYQPPSKIMNVNN